MARQPLQDFRTGPGNVASDALGPRGSRAASVGLPLRQALYHQVFKIIRDRIVDGELAPGACLPNEFELAGEFQVSIGTIRKAVDLLVDGRLLVRQQGRGTFVSAERWAPPARLCDLLRDGEGLPYSDWRTEELAYELSTPPEDVATELVLSASGQAHKIVRVHHATGGACVYEIIWLSFQFFPSALSEADRGDRSALLRRRGVLVENANRKVRVEMAAQDVARGLGVREKTPLISLTRALTAEDGRNIEIAQAYCVSGAGWIDLG